LEGCKLNQTIIRPYTIIILINLTVLDKSLYSQVNEALIENSYQFNEYSSRRIVKKISGENWKKGLDTAKTD